MKQPLNPSLLLMYFDPEELAELTPGEIRLLASLECEPMPVVPADQQEEKTIVTPGDLILLGMLVDGLPLDVHDLDFRLYMPEERLPQLDGIDLSASARTHDEVDICLDDLQAGPNQEGGQVWFQSDGGTPDATAEAGAQFSPTELHNVDISRDSRHFPAKTRGVLDHHLSVDGCCRGG